MTYCCRKCHHKKVLEVAAQLCKEVEEREHLKQAAISAVKEVNNCEAMQTFNKTISKPRGYIAAHYSTQED